MVDTEPSLEEPARSRSRSLSSLTHSKWREKLREKAGRLRGTAQPSLEQQQSNITDFLGSSSARLDNKPLSLGLQIPKGDTPEPESSAPNQIQYKKPPKVTKGLHVTFSEKEPDVIGEGGDECELPTQHVVGSWSGPQATPDIHSTQQKITDATASLSLGSPGELLAPDRYKPTQDFERSATRNPVGGWVERRLSMNMEEGMVQAGKGEEVLRTEESSYSTLLPFDAVTVPSEGQASSSPEGVQIQPADQIAAGQTDRGMSNSTLFSTSKSSRLSPLPYPNYERSTSAKNLGHTGMNTSPQLPVKSETFLPQTPPQSSPQLTRPKQSNTEQLSTHIQTSEGHSADPNSQAGGIESDDFYSRVQHLRGVFRLAASKAVDVENMALEQWIRMSSWWFIRGKTMLEGSTSLPSQTHDQTDDGQATKRNHQCYVDLAKAWWSVEEVIPPLIDPHGKSSTAVKFGKYSNLDITDLLEAYKILQGRLRDLAVYMHHHDLLPPPTLLIQGADPCIWLDYPALPPGILCLTATLDTRTLIKRKKPLVFPFVFHDSGRWFCYGHYFATAEISSRNGIEAGQIPCIVSMFRATDHSDIHMIVLSQDGQIDLHVQSDPDLGPLWKDVDWQHSEHALSFMLSRDFRLVVSLWESEYRIIADVVHRSKRYGTGWFSAESEEILFDDTVPAFHCVGMERDTPFASIPVKNCPVRLFRRTAVRFDGATQRRFFNGFRLVARAPVTQKIIGCIDRVFGHGSSILHSNLRGENDAPALLLAFRDGNLKPSIILTFRDVEQRLYFHTATSGQLLSQREISSNDIPLLSMAVVDLFSNADGTTISRPLSPLMKWAFTKVMNEAQGEGLEHVMFSDCLRICSQSDIGTVVDLSNLATGELQISLDVVDIKTIKLYRPAQDNLIISFADSLFPKNEHAALQETLRLIAQDPTARQYDFATLDGLHQFQKVATGFDVIYDGFATTFSISHRRNMIPLYKKQEATRARLQVLTYENRGQKTFQLLGVFSDFPDGKIMNFQLKSTDVFDAVMKSGKHCVRLVDAKFALPKHPDSKDTPWDFVCLDVPEYPAEHDDIVIGFETEQERNVFAQALPAPIKASRLQALRR